MVSLFCHIGLGDLILLSGAVVTLLRRHGSLRIYCYAAHEASVRSFFAVYPNLRIVPVPRGASPYGLPEESALRPTVDGPIIRCCFYRNQSIRRDISFPELFYSQLGVDYKERWASCPLEEAAATVPQLETEIPVFVHDDAVRGFRIVREVDGQAVYRPFESGESILQFVQILRRAKTIHA